MSVSFYMKHFDPWLLLQNIWGGWLSDNFFLLYLVVLFPQSMRLWKNQSIILIKTGRLMTDHIPIWISYNLKNKSYSNTLNLSFWSILIMISCRVNNYATNVFIWTWFHNTKLLMILGLKIYWFRYLFCRILYLNANARNNCQILMFRWKWKIALLPELYYLS